MNNSNDLLKKLQLIKEEDYIWIVYFFIVLFAIISNYFEKNYLFTKNKSSYIKYKNINTTILIVAFFIYLYYVILSYDALKNGKYSFNSFLRLVGAILFLVAGGIYVYADYSSNNESVDIEII